MTIENVMLTLNRLPKISAVIDAGTDWVAIGGIAVTLATVIAGALVTISTFKRTMRSQSELARAVALKDSRQGWINDLRGTCSEYIAAVGILQHQSDSREIHSIFIDKVTAVDSSAAAGLIADWEHEKRRARQSALALKSKIELLSNPNESDFRELIDLARAAFDRAVKVNGGSQEVCIQIVEKAQQILKTEWNRAKKME
ncbi:hypothetical protein ACNFBR_10455 [Pseudomonas sp. NY11955]|uniref:hypothetical protein n=1 Tax=Pseudomonas sp. NY11955 TaxID=3400363 RepID=UPI003A8A2997